MNQNHDLNKHRRDVLILSGTLVFFGVAGTLLNWYLYDQTNLNKIKLEQLSKETRYQAVPIIGNQNDIQFLTDTLGESGVVIANKVVGAPKQDKISKQDLKFFENEISFDKQNDGSVFTYIKRSVFENDVLFKVAELAIKKIEKEYESKVLGVRADNNQKFYLVNGKGQQFMVSKELAEKFLSLIIDRLARINKSNFESYYLEQLITIDKSSVLKTGRNLLIFLKDSDRFLNNLYVIYELTSDGTVQITDLLTGDRIDTKMIKPDVADRLFTKLNEHTGLIPVKLHF